MMLKNYKLFLDLDGVLADMDARFRQITGKEPHEVTSGDFWRTVSSHGNFFDSLEWMPGGRELWGATKHLHPTILTGTPKDHKNDYEQQKRRWCARELGLSVSVICCESKDKIREALLVCNNGQTPVLIDDWDKYQDAWEDHRGVFIHHYHPHDSLKALKLLLGMGEPDLDYEAYVPLNVPPPPLTKVNFTFRNTPFSRGGVDIQVELLAPDKIHRVRTRTGADITYLFVSGPLEAVLMEQVKKVQSASAQETGG